MDIQTIDGAYQQLQSQAQETIGEIKDLAGKLQAAAQGGDQNAREWLLDLKGVALAIQAEQTQVAGLLQALHGFVANQSDTFAVPQVRPAAPPPVPAPPPSAYASQGFAQPAYAQPAYAQPYGQGMGQGMNQGMNQGYAPGFGPQAGGLLGSFLNSGFGRAIEMGAGFGIGSDLINALF